MGDVVTPNFGADGISRILVWDHRVMVVGHSANKAACVAISAAVQTAAAIARSFVLVENVSLYNNANDEPVYDVQLLDCEHSRQLLAGLMASFAGIAKTAEGPNRPRAMMVSDHRQRIPEKVEFGITDADMPDKIEAKLLRT
jgi:hypothetical protein